MASAVTEAPLAEEKLVRGLGLLDSTMLVAGSMIGSGIFIVSSIIARQVGSPGWLLVVWIVTGLLTLTAALSYGELAAMMPKAGGQYVYLREAFSPLWGFLYGWTLFLVIQTGTIAAVAVGFARYSGVLLPWVSESNYIISPIRFGGYALSLSTAQLVGLALIGFLTFTNTRGLEIGKLIQNVFTTAKTGALLALIVLGIIIGLKSGRGAENFRDFWTVRGDLQDVGAGLTAAAAFGLFVGICVAQTNSLFSADAWNNITFTAGEVVNPRRNVPLSLALGTFLVIGLYLLANVAYLATLPFNEIQNAPSDRVASETANVIFPGAGATIMAIAIMISTFGCNNGLILAGARAYYAMAKDGLVLSTGRRVKQMPRPGVGARFPRHLGRRTRSATHGQNRCSRQRDRLRQSLRQFARLRYFSRADLLRPNNHWHLSTASKTAGCGTTLQSIRLSNRSRSVHRWCDRHSCSALYLSNGDDVAGADDRVDRRAGLFLLEKSKSNSKRNRAAAR